MAGLGSLRDRQELGGEALEAAFPLPTPLLPFLLNAILQQ
jgi:hypothetical protein